MAGAQPPLGVISQVPTPAPPAAPVPLPAPPKAVSGAPPLWPPVAQWCTAAGLAVCLTLLAWHGYGLSRYSARPLSIEQPLPAIDLNRSEPADLELVPGLGPTLARRIVEDRQKNGPFRSVEDLRRVSGIGPATLERLEHFLVVESYPQAPAPAAPPPRIVRGARPDPDPPAAGGKENALQAAKTKKPAPAGRIDINTASQKELQQLPGIGPTLSARIIEVRRDRPFGSAEDLRKVKGIGVKTLERLRPLVTVGNGDKPS